MPNKFRRNRLTLSLMMPLWALSSSVAQAQAAGAPAEPASPAKTRNPNIVFILADDLGWMDTSLYGSKYYRTPNIDALAKRGMMFTRAYTANPLCSPTRASLMTGLDPARIGFTSPRGHLPEIELETKVVPQAPPGVKALQTTSVTRLDSKYFTLAEALKAKGYATGHFGKWHLGSEPYSPLEQGFDVDVPHYDGPSPGKTFVAPWSIPNFEGKPGEHLEDRMAKEASRYIVANKDKPFFLNYWAFSVHSPFNAKRALINKYRPGADDANPQHSPTYAAMVESLDDAVGTLVKTLDQQKLTDNTLLIFYSDNGGNMYDRVDKTTPTSNAPLRGGKATIYEGGTHVPLIVSWPGKIEAGTKSDALVSSIDFYPTLLDVLNIKAQPGQKFDGISILPALKGQTLARDTIFSHFPHYVNRTGNLPSTYVHQGDWKLIRFYADNDDQTDRFELYNLRDDVGETKNLAAQMPDKVKALNTLISQYLIEREVVAPIPNPNYDKDAAAKQPVGNANNAQAKKPQTRKPAGKADLVAGGWLSRGVEKLTVANGSLNLTILGTDPYIIAKALPKAQGPYTLEMRMRSTSNAAGQVFWLVGPVPPKITFSAERRLDFVVQPNGEWQNYSIKIPEEKAMHSVRIDPGGAPGNVAFENIRLLDSQNKVVKNWAFKTNP